MTSERNIVQDERAPIGNEKANSGRRPRATSLYGARVEYGLHALLWLIDDKPRRASSRDLSDIQGIPPAMLAKIMPKLEKAGIVRSIGGISGGYELAKSASEISVRDVVEAVEPGRKLFDCQEVRRGCVLFGGSPPDWAVSGVCRVHAAMLKAEKRMRLELTTTTLADLVIKRQPADFGAKVSTWFHERGTTREATRIAAVKGARRNDTFA